jgi:hypothetical protein
LRAFGDALPELPDPLAAVDSCGQATAGGLLPTGSPAPGSRSGTCRPPQCLRRQGTREHLTHGMKRR